MDFGNIKKFGINGAGNFDLFSDLNKQEEDAKKGTKKSVTPEDLLYFKSYTCHVCGKDFENSALKIGKNPLVRTDTDLRPYYEHLDPVLYDIIHCPFCGYSALARFFNTITDKQITNIKENISVNFKKTDYPLVLTEDMALERYMLAIFTAFHKNCKNGEKAYLCLKTAWIYRSKNDEANEKKMLENAYKGFSAAYEKESFPICGMEEPTITYLLGDIARRIGLYEDSARYLSRVLLSKSSSSKLKDRARDVRELLKEDKANADKAKGL